MNAIGFKRNIFHLNFNAAFKKDHMSSNPSYLDVSIIKGKQIIWNIDLSKNENPLPAPIPEIPDSPKTLFQLAQNYINSIYSDPHETIPDFPVHDTSKSVRKLAKKIIKYKRFSLSKLSIQVKRKFRDF